MCVCVECFQMIGRPFPLHYLPTLTVVASLYVTSTPARPALASTASGTRAVARWATAGKNLWRVERGVRFCCPVFLSFGLRGGPACLQDTRGGAEQHARARAFGQHGGTTRDPPFVLCPNAPSLSPRPPPNHSLLPRGERMRNHGCGGRGGHADVGEEGEHRVFFSTARRELLKMKVELCRRPCPTLLTTLLHAPAGWRPLSHAATRAPELTFHLTPPTAPPPSHNAHRPPRVRRRAPPRPAASRAPPSPPRPPPSRHASRRKDPQCAFLEPARPPHPPPPPPRTARCV